MKTVELRLVTGLVLEEEGEVLVDPGRSLGETWSRRVQPLGRVKEWGVSIVHPEGDTVSGTVGPEGPSHQNQRAQKLL